MRNFTKLLRLAAAVALACVAIAGLSAQAKPPVQAPTGGAKPGANPPAPPPNTVTPPPGYVIGIEDVLVISFWRDKDMSGEVVVRPDGMITLQLLNDVKAAGLTPDQLRDELSKLSSKYMPDPTITVFVRQINSRKVTIQGSVGKPGVYPLTGPTTILQLIAMAGGLADFAESKRIVVIRVENGQQRSIPVNYEDLKKGKNLQKYNIELKPGDTIIVP